MAGASARAVCCSLWTELTCHCIASCPVHMYMLYIGLFPCDDVVCCAVPAGELAVPVWTEPITDHSAHIRHQKVRAD